MTAYASLKKIAEPKAGEVAFVSGAAGAVGLVAGQLLKRVYGCKVIGSAGTDEKVGWVVTGVLCCLHTPTGFTNGPVAYEAILRISFSPMSKGFAVHCSTLNPKKSRRPAT